MTMTSPVGEPRTQSEALAAANELVVQASQHRSARRFARADQLEAQADHYRHLAPTLPEEAPDSPAPAPLQEQIVRLEAKIDDDRLVIRALHERLVLVEDVISRAGEQAEAELAAEAEADGAGAGGDDPPKSEAPPAEEGQYPEEGTVPEVLAWVGDDVAKAEYALAAEASRDGEPRVGVTEKLGPMVDAART